jgi:Spy/CpxP family protein refolding chaperone
MEIMKTRIALLIGVVALIIGGVVLVAAQGGQEPGQRPPRREGMPPPPPPFGVPDIEHLAQAFNLTESQVADLKPFLDSERAAVDALQRKVGESHHQIEVATKDGHFDEAQVRALAAQHAQAQADLIVEQQRVKAKIYNVLTPEQRAKMEQMHRQGPGPGGPRGPHGPGGPGGPGGPEGGPPPPPPPPRPDN